MQRSRIGMAIRGCSLVQRISLLRNHAIRNKRRNGQSAIGNANRPEHLSRKPMPLAIKPVVSANKENIRWMKLMNRAVGNATDQRKETRVIFWHGSDGKHGEFGRLTKKAEPRANRDMKQPKPSRTTDRCNARWLRRLVRLRHFGKLQSANRSI